MNPTKPESAPLVSVKRHYWGYALHTRAMRLIVTGASGFVGRGLLPSLAAFGHEGIATGREVPSPLPTGWTGRRRDDVLGTRDLRGSIDAIIHLEVKQHAPRPTVDDLAEFEQVNVHGTRDWTDWAAENNIRRFVYLSSIKAVGEAPTPHYETDDSLPGTPYGRSKAAGEAIVRAWSQARDNRMATVLRPAPVYGPGNAANLAAFVRQIQRGRPCIVGAGEARKSVVSRGNLCASICFLLGREQAACETYNVSDVETLSVAALGGLIADLGGWPAPKTIPATLATLVAPIGDIIGGLTGRDFPLTTSRLRALREESVFPCDKLVAAGFHHPLSLREGLAEMITWATSPAVG
jgi:nucleoside-diphosphate-sugar epimerase